MNSLKRDISPTEVDGLEGRFALRVAARLTERSLEIEPDVGERLRVARERALERARQVRATQSPQVKTGFTAAGLAILGGGGWWPRLGVALPLVALIVGIAFIQEKQMDEQVAVAADIDAALLADDVPPTAYRDPGFVEFLKSPRN